MHRPFAWIILAVAVLALPACDSHDPPTLSDLGDRYGQLAEGTFRFTDDYLDSLVVGPAVRLGPETDGGVGVRMTSDFEPDSFVGLQLIVQAREFEEPEVGDEFGAYVSYDIGSLNVAGGRTDGVVRITSVSPEGAISGVFRSTLSAAGLAFGYGRVHIEGGFNAVPAAR